MGPLLRQMAVQIAYEACYEYARKMASGSRQSKRYCSVDRSCSSFSTNTLSTWGGHNVVRLNHSLDPQLQSVQNLYQQGFIGFFEAPAQPKHRVIGFINGRANSPESFAHHARRIASYGWHVLGLYNPHIPHASRFIDYSQALRVLLPRNHTCAATAHIPTFIQLGTQMKGPGRFMVIAHSHGYALLAQSILQQGEFWARHASRVSLYGLAGVSSIPALKDLDRVNFCSESDWAVQLLLKLQLNFGDRQLIEKPLEKGPCHRLWGPGYVKKIEEILAFTK